MHLTYIKVSPDRLPFRGVAGRALPGKAWQPGLSASVAEAFRSSGVHDAIFAGAELFVMFSWPSQTPLDVANAGLGLAEVFSLRNPIPFRFMLLSGVRERW